jgi:hypothetical protein
MSTDRETTTSVGNSPVASIPAALERLIAEQGVANSATYEHRLGCGRDLWDNDTAFELFL